jgi:hypothetical protein
MEDIAAAAGLLLPPGFSERLKSADAHTPKHTNLEADGLATIAGRQGKRFKMKGSDSTDRLVVSDDASLKPVGAAMEGVANASVASMAVLFGKEVGEDLLPHIRDMFSRGTPLLTFDGWVLTSAEKADVSQDRGGYQAGRFPFRKLAGRCENPIMLSRPTRAASPLPSSLPFAS